MIMRKILLRVSGGIVLAATSAMALATPSAVVRVEPPAPAQPATQLAQAYPQTYPAPAYRAPAMSGWEQEKVRLAALARQQGVREATIQAVVPGLQLNNRVMQLDYAQRPTGSSTAVQNFSNYLSRHVTSSLISRGQSRYYSHWARLSRIEQLTGVDPSVIMAIYGKETSYGAVTGNFDLLEALASLAYEGRRREFFEGEFVAALKLMDQGVRRYQLKGSYAGATGYPQFMPSVALRLRADGDGDGYADIWRNEDDAFASIANYLRDAGWKRGVPWGVPVRIPATLNRAAIRSRIVAPRCPAVFGRHSRWMTVAEWRRLGVTPGGSRALAETELATLMETPGAYAEGYLLTTNYRAILDYNCSNFYGMGVGLLANAIARR
jgi:membrane-bound lytic murein transglycosylase B